MSYIVIQHGVADLPSYSEFEDIERAALYLEGVCNETGSAEAKLYRLEPVNFEVRKVFKVEVPADADVSRSSSPLREFGTLEPNLAELDAQLTNGPRRGLFGR